MAQFIGAVMGQGGRASRLGSQASGLVVTANGWDIGARVTIEHEDGRDVVRVWRTGGSNNRTTSVLLAEYAEDKPLPLCVHAMGCYCAGHARGNKASEACDTREDAR